MKVITVVSDEEHQGFFLLKLTCAINDLKLVALVSCQKSFTTNRLKDSLLNCYLDDVSDDECVLFTDGYDALFMATEEEILTKFRKFKKDLVFSAETNCWPDKALAELYPRTGSSPYVFLNSGGFIGKAGFLKHVLNELSSTTDKFSRSNQYLWSHIFLRNQELIGLDTSCEIFCTFSPEVGEAHLPKGNDNNFYSYYCFMHNWFQQNFKIDNARIYNRITGTKPCHVHFNGDSKILIDGEIKSMLLSRVSTSAKTEILYESR